MAIQALSLAVATDIYNHLPPTITTTNPNPQQPNNSNPPTDQTSQTSPKSPIYPD